MNWSSDPPWEQTNYEHGVANDCARCGGTMEPYWRHYWPPCRRCRIWSYFGVHFLGLLGLNARPWMYWGARPWCDDCGGTGWLLCEPQDLSVLRVSGACSVCNESAFKLVHATAEQHGDVEGSQRHYRTDIEFDHEAVVGSAPLVRALTDVFNRLDP